jgi:hypothetical protein
MMKGVRTLAIAAALGVVLAPTHAAAGSGASPASVRKQIESSMVVSGQIDIEPDGSVSRLELDHEDQLPDGVIKLVRGNAMQWKFEPVERDGHLVKARAPMSLRVVAKKLDNGDYQVALRGVSFERYDAKDPTGLGTIKMEPPSYPSSAIRARAGGTVYLAVKVGRNGRVEEAVAEQVNLRIIAAEGDMRRLRKAFADSAIDAARQWSFRVPTQGPEAGRPFWNVRLPVSYALSRDDPQPYGKWVAYVPGPRQPAPWLQAGKNGESFLPDTLADGGVYLADSQAPRLLTPLQGG